jgi:exocyst complex component 4
VQEALTRSDSHESVKYLQTLVECLALLGKLAAAGSALSQRLRPTLRELIADVIKSRAQAAERARPRVDSIPKTSAGGSPMLLGGAHSATPHGPRGGFAGANLGGGSAAGGPTGAVSVAAQQLLEEVFGVCIGALENHRLVHTFMQMRAAEDQGARAVLSPPREEGLAEGFKRDGGGGAELAPYNLGVAWSCVQSECQALVCEILRATPAGVSADQGGLVGGVKEGVKKGGPPGGSAAKGGEGALEGEDEELAFAFRFTDLGSALPGRKKLDEGQDLHKEGIYFGAVAVNILHMPAD